MCDLSTLPSYQSGPLIDVCLAVLGSKNVRALTMDQQAVDFGILNRHLKKLLVNVRTSGKRTKTIRRLVPNAGSYVFPKDGYNTTIAVGFNIFIAYLGSSYVPHRNTFGMRIMSD